MHGIICLLGDQEFLLIKSLARVSTLLLSSPGFCGTLFYILMSVLKVPIKMKFLVLQMHAPPLVYRKLIKGLLF